jgi:hypothetical protein
VALQWREGDRREQRGGNAKSKKTRRIDHHGTPSLILPEGLCETRQGDVDAIQCLFDGMGALADRRSDS